MQLDEILEVRVFEECDVYSGSRWKQYFIGELSSKVQFRWRLDQSPTFSWYSTIAISPASQEDIVAAQHPLQRAEAEAKLKAENKAKLEAEAATKAAAAGQQVTINCVKGKMVRKVTTKKPKCPAGDKKK